MVVQLSSMTSHLGHSCRKRISGSPVRLLKLRGKLQWKETWTASCPLVHCSLEHVSSPAAHCVKTSPRCRSPHAVGPAAWWSAGAKGRGHRLTVRETTKSKFSFCHVTSSVARSTSRTTSLSQIPDAATPLDDCSNRCKKCKCVCVCVCMYVYIHIYIYIYIYI